MVLSACAQLVSLSLASLLIYLSRPGSDLFSWHPSVMSVAFLISMLQALLVMNRRQMFNVFVNPKSGRDQRIQLHWMLHALSLLLAVLAFCVVYVNKEVNQRRHLTTWHALVGLVTLLSAISTALVGLMLRQGGSLLSALASKRLRAAHGIAGGLVFTMAMITIFLAHYSNWHRNRVANKWLRIISASASLFVALVVLRQVTLSWLPRLLKPRESSNDAKRRRIQEKIDEKIRRQALNKAASNNDITDDDDTEDDDDVDTRDEQEGAQLGMKEE